jgi:hypothetical protein
MALREIQRTPNIRVAALLTTVTGDYDRISMHGARRILLERQGDRQIRFVGRSARIQNLAR